MARALGSTWTTSGSALIAFTSAWAIVMPVSPTMPLVVTPVGPDEEHVVGRDVEGPQDGQAMARRDLLDAVRRRVQQELIRRTGIRRDETQRRHADGLRRLRDAGLLREGSQRETEQGWKHPRQASWFWANGVNSLGTRDLRNNTNQRGVRRPRPLVSHRL